MKDIGRATRQVYTRHQKEARMSKNVYAILILALASGPAWSQRFSEYRLSGALSSDLVRDEVLCLIRKSNGRVECRSRYDWRQLAARIDKARERDASRALPVD